jgi:hypothetical protein
MIDDKEALKSLKATEKQAKESQAAMKKLGEGAAKVGQAIAVGVGVAVTSLVAMAVKTADVAGAIDDAAQRVGTTAEEYQKWAYAAKLSGMEQEKLEQIMIKQQKTFADATSGSKAAAQAYKDLGVNIDEWTSDEAFEQVVLKLSKMEDETKRNALANDIFGKSYADMAPLLNQGSEGIKQLRQDAVDLGGVMSNESVASGAAFGDSLDKMNTSISGIVNEIGMWFLPVLQQMLDWVNTNMPTIKQVAGDIFTAVGDAIKWVSDNSNWLIPILAGVLGGFVALKIIGIVSAMIGIFNAVLAAATAAGGLFNLVMLANPLTWVVLGVVALIAAIVALVMNFDKVKKAASDLWNSIKDFFGKIGNFIGGVFDKFKEVIKLPKLSITGSLNPIKWVTEGLPKLNVKWNAEGGIFDSPTIFGTQYGLQGVGEAGPEAIMPLSKLQDLLDMNTIDYDQLANSLKRALRGMAIQLDDDKVGEFIDTRLIRGTV